MDKVSKIYCGKKNWIEGTALEQFKRVLNFDNIIEGYAFPDLHPGKGVPVGTAFLSKDMIYPSLIMSDVGCGFTLFKTNIHLRKFKKDKFLRKLNGNIEDIIHHKALELFDNSVKDNKNMIGTIGHGNHFIELLEVEDILDEKLCKLFNINKHEILLLVHCGSRIYGEDLWINYVTRYKEQGIDINSKEGMNYFNKHQELIEWSSYNRRLIGKVIGNMLSCELEEILNLTHNSITHYKDNLYIHRKGASEIIKNKLCVIAGSRGNYSYLINPVYDINLNSISHGAGRKWNRNSTRERMKDKYKNIDELFKTKLGTEVLCQNKNLLYEEAPEAYKDIKMIIDDINEFNLASIVARLKPIINIKP